jgi:hypothetical protein
MRAAVATGAIAGHALEEVLLRRSLGRVFAGSEGGEVRFARRGMCHNGNECADVQQALVPLYYRAHQNQRQGEGVERVAGVHGVAEGAECNGHHIHAQKAHSRHAQRRVGLEGPSQVRFRADTLLAQSRSALVSSPTRIGLALRYKVLGADRVQVQKEGRLKFWQDMRSQGKLEPQAEAAQVPAASSE